jgi:beta-glucanase (GH16 family)
MKTLANNFRIRGFLSLAFLICCKAHGANVLVNPGFEASPVGQPISGWQTYGPNNYTESDLHARTGNNYYKVYGQFSANDNFTGLYQETSSTPGTTYTADGWAFSLSADGGGIHGQDQFWLEVTFRDAGLNTLALYRSDLVTSNYIASHGGLDHWFNLPVTNAWSFTNVSGNPVALALTNSVTNLVAPSGAAFARYQTVFHQGPDNANGSAYLDDCSLNQTSVSNVPGSAWNIVWSDEFEGASIATTNWTFETGNNGGWGNNELEYYTSRSQNAYVANGLLHLVALRESFSGFNYTSARIKSQNHFSKQYGRLEFCAKLPFGVGFWPAIWMLGNNFPSVGWPACGEIDIVENKGSVPGQVQGTLHYSDASNNHLQSTAFYNFPANNGATNFHTYRLDWSTNSIQWLVDGQIYENQTSWSSSTGPYPAPYNQPYYFILNLAVGGNYLGNPTTNTINANSVFPGDMQLDYIRVYDLTAPLQISVTGSNGAFALSWPSNIVCHLQAQTNAAGLTTNWFDVPGAVTPYSIPIPPGNPAAFYRLRSP